MAFGPVVPRLAHPAASNLRPMLVAALLAAGTYGCAPADPPELRIGVVVLSDGPLTAVLGIPGRQGAELAVDEINAAGGVMVGGVAHRVSLRIQPTASRPDAAASAVAALINIDSVEAVIAPLTSALAAPAAGVAHAARVLFIAPMASNPAVTEGRDVAYRLAFTDAFQGELLANFAYDSLALRRVAALSDEASAYGQEIVRIFRDRFERRGGRMVAVEGFASDGPSDFRPQLRRLLAQRPDALLLPNYIGYDSIQVRQAREMGFTGRFLGTDSWDPGALVHLPLTRGTIVVANWDDRSPEPEARRFVAAYRDRFAAVPRTAAAATYDAVHLIALAARRRGEHGGGSLARALAGLGDHRGASAHFTFNGPGAPERGAVIMEVLEGRDTLRLVTRPDD